jgi:acetoin utilization deacetylase AcuC-like enzyme
MQRVFAPVALAYAPDVILVSCGFDAHRDDPLASMEVSETGFHAMASVLRHVADEICGGRVAFILEGGYALSGLREGTRAVLRACRPNPPAAPGTVDAPAGSLLRQVVEQVRAVHGPRFRGLGGA